MSYTKVSNNDRRKTARRLRDAANCRNVQISPSALGRLIKSEDRSYRGILRTLADLIEPEAVDQDVDDELVREKVIDLPPMTEEEALVQTDLIGHDFYVFTNATTGLVNVIYHRKNGGYGIIKPKIEEPDE